MINTAIDFITNTLGVSVLDFTCLCILAYLFYISFGKLFIKLIRMVI